MHSPAAYYNEIDPYAAQWLRNLIAAGHIAPGDVDTRSIEDVHPDDLRPYTQCHFFAGVGVWSYALRRAGWPDDRSVWTGSCPCQPFSAAGKGAGFDDERHLWPHWHWLIRERRPAAILGEQVASKDADHWVDLVHADLEGLGYAFGAVPFPSAGIGAPHIRDRNYWVAYAERAGVRPCRRGEDAGAAGSLQSAHGEWQWLRADAGERSAVRGMAHTHGGHAGAEREQRSGQQRQQPQDGSAGRLADADGERRSMHAGSDGSVPDRPGIAEPDRGTADHGPGPVNGFWRDADWLLCRDGKWRPVEPGTFPLAHGAPARVGRLRAYGNAINAVAAQIWIETVMECMP